MFNLSQRRLFARATSWFIFSTSCLALNTINDAQATRPEISEHQGSTKSFSKDVSWRNLPAALIAQQAIPSESEVDFPLSDYELISKSTQGAFQAVAYRGPQGDIYFGFGGQHARDDKNTLALLECLRHLKEEQTPPAEHQLFYEHEVVRYWARNNATNPAALILEFDRLKHYYVNLMCYDLERKKHDELNESRKSDQKVAWRQKEPQFSDGWPKSRDFSTSWEDLVSKLKERRKRWFHNFIAQGETLEDGFDDSSNVSFLSLRDFTQGCKKDEALSLPDFDYDTYPVLNGMTKELEEAMRLLSKINALKKHEQFPIQNDTMFARRFVDRAIKDHNPTYVYYTGDSYGGVVASHLLHTTPNDGHQAIIFNSPLLTRPPAPQANIVRLMRSNSPLRHMGEAKEEHALPSHDKSALNFVQKDINRLTDIQRLVSQKNLSVILQKHQDNARKLEDAYGHWVRLTNEVTELANAARPPASTFSWGNSSPVEEFKITREETANKHWFQEDTFSTLMRSHGHLVPKGMYPDLTMPDAGDMNETEPNVDKEGEETPPSMGSEEGSYPLLLPQNTADHEAESEFSMEKLLTRPMPRNPQHDLGLLVDDLMYWSQEGRSLAQQRAVKVRHSIKEELQLKGVLSTAYGEYRSFMCLENFCEYIPEYMEKAKGNVKERLEYFYGNWPKGRYSSAKALRDQIEEIHDSTEKATTETKALQSQLQQHGELAQLEARLKFIKANFPGLHRAIEEYNRQSYFINHLEIPTEPTQSVEDTLNDLLLAYSFLTDPTSSTHPSKRMLTLLQELALSGEGKKTLTKIMQEYVSELGNVKNTYETENNSARHTLNLWKEWNDRCHAVLPTLRKISSKSRSDWMMLLNTSFLTTEQIDQEAEKAGINRPFETSLLGRTSMNNPKTGDVEYIDTFLESQKLEVKRLNDRLEEVNSLLQAESSWYNPLTQKSYDCDSLNKALEKCLNHQQILESTQDEELKAKLELQFMKERLHLQQEVKEHEARFQTVRVANASNS